MRFINVIIQNIVNPDIVKTSLVENSFFDDVTITSALRSDILMRGQIFLIF